MSYDKLKGVIFMPRNIAGRPKKYSPAAFRRGVNRYFASISREKILTEKVFTGYTEDGKEIYEKRTIENALGEEARITEYLVKPSVAGLCGFLGMHRDTFNAYSHDDEYKDICDAAKNEIESYLCTQLGSGKGDSGIIFNLTHNFGWKNRVEVDAGAETRKALEKAPMTTDDKVKWLIAHGYEIPGLKDGRNDEEDQ